MLANVHIRNTRSYRYWIHLMSNVMIAMYVAMYHSVSVY